MTGATQATRALLLIFNAGSSSLKYEVVGSDDCPVVAGEVTRIGLPDASHQVAVAGAGAAPRVAAVPCLDHTTAVAQALDDLRAAATRQPLTQVQAVGHRFVHGGPDLWAPVRVDAGVVATIERAVDLAPLHNGPSLEVLRAARAALPRVPHVAVFDTGFHHALPVVARTYALPNDLVARWRIRRYGFHGISCAYLVRRVAELGIAPARRLVVCHLGAGASVTAVLDGRAHDTSMGFTPLEGLVMGTRSGDLDPGLVVYLQRHAGLDADALDRVLERESGLRGLGGRSGDYAELERLAAAGDARAALALDVFAYRVRKYLGAYWAALGGVDVVVFSGGIGEHSAAARRRIVTPLAEVGWHLDPVANESGPPERIISRSGALPAMWVIPTREAVQIARQVRALLAGDTTTAG